MIFRNQYSHVAPRREANGRPKEPPFRTDSPARLQAALFLLMVALPVLLAWSAADLLLKTGGWARWILAALLALLTAAHVPHKVGLDHEDRIR